MDEDDAGVAAVVVKATVRCVAVWDSCGRPVKLLHSPGSTLRDAVCSAVSAAPSPATLRERAYHVEIRIVS